MPIARAHTIIEYPNNSQKHKTAKTVCYVLFEIDLLMVCFRPLMPLYTF